MIEIDARGFSCPQPLMMAKAALDKANGETVVILVDSATPRDNIKRYATRKKFDVTVAEEGLDFRLTIQ